MVQLGLMAIGDVAADASVCGMPVERQIERLESALAACGRDRVRIALTDLLDLAEAERHAALDAMVADEPSPYVIVGGRVVCTGSVDVEAVLASLE